MRVAVAGCAGFIGFHLTERLLAEGHAVLGLDNLSSGSRGHIADLQRHTDFTFLEQDICTPLAIEGPLERIYNLACPASPADFGPRRLMILGVCSHGVWNLLELAGATGARLLHASTSEVYGDPKEHPQRESYWGHVNPIGSRSCYDEGKRFSESLLIAHRDVLCVDVRLPRIFNTYGPRMRVNDGRMLPTFINQALHGKPITVHGDGLQTRSFCYVSDMVEGLIRLMESDVRDPVNLGNPVEITVLQAAQEVIRLTGSRSPIIHVERPADDPSVRQPDITLAQERLGWAPRVTREDGFARTVGWFRDHPPS
jgi:nucleoside-diphosphate-sugar epimerase